ncbi:LysM peptidoglycan-binding domain-containing protein [Chengkuizengella sediminis]|uniref:LysM peptidoglycan-binding domain-containing protein n=1 Tax=Chengkuizengella sediminis TaxID=1885917 RepID=UPI00138A38D0|nr:LysM peptidoglycan-binding domain-containing protein [Chengkuizengella sediminis]NDI35131.1 LysM peptidoglycan-binding domain-containing protein [Chengkuizengella sediminis]
MLIHTINPGETLWQVAQSYRVPMSKIIEINKLPDPNKLVIGQSIVIPTEDFIHIVKPGETLWKIAQNYGTSVQAIVQANQITDPVNIFPGGRLYIPAPRYYVRPGDTLWKIAQNYGISLQTLISVNDMKPPYLIYPGMMLIIPRKEKPVIDVNAYIYKLGDEAIPIVKEVGKYLTSLTPSAYAMKEDGSLQQIEDSQAIETSFEENVIPMMSITNFTATDPGSDLAHDVLNNQEIQEELISNILTIMKEKGYQGLNVNLENVLPEDREPYNQFLQLVVDRLHPEGYFVSSALIPKVSSRNDAYDYEAHGRIADYVILMTYEWGYRLGPPQAISPINQIKRVLDYAVTVIPREKIFFGFQIYARDWLLPHVQGQVAETFSSQEAILRAVKYGADIKYDAVTQSPYYRYTDEQGRMHEVWFEDARSAQAKFDTVKDYDLKGISYWVLGYPFPQNWVLLEDNFTVKKQT